MPTESDNLKDDLTKSGLRAWGRALIKTGTEHLDLAMVLHGKKTLKEAEEMPDEPDEG